MNIANVTLKFKPVIIDNNSIIYFDVASLDNSLFTVVVRISACLH